MLKFYFKSTLRLILKNKVLSSIKLIGLSIGIMTFLVASLFSLHELNFDTQHLNVNRLYRYVHRISTPEGLQSLAGTSATVAPALKERFPEIESYARVYTTPVTVRNPVNDVAFNEIKFCFVDSTFLDLFNFPLQPNTTKKNILTDPYSIILSPSISRKYFGTENPVGKSLTIAGQMEFVVKGVFSSDMKLSHFNFDFVASFSTLQAIRNVPPQAAKIQGAEFLEHKGYNAFQTYLLLTKDASAENLQNKFPAFIEDFRGAGKSNRIKPNLQTVQSIHLNSNLMGELSKNGSIQSVYIFFTVGSLILLIACVNYINISTAEFIIRAKGVSLKKILGVTRISLLVNHLSETALLTMISILLGVVFAYLILPSVNLLLESKIEIQYNEVLAILLVILFFIVLVAGMYPAYSISKIGTMEVFRNSLKVTKGILNLRNYLVSFQILCSFCLIVLFMLMQNQLNFLLRKDLGFNTRQVVVINAGTMSPQNINSYKSVLVGAKEILAVGGCSTPPGDSFQSLGIALPGQDGDDERRTMVYHSFVDEGYLKALGLSIDEGRFYSDLSPIDSIQYLIVNQAAAKIIKGNSTQPLNVPLEFPNLLMPGTRIRKEVIGVVKDFNYASLHTQIDPMMLELNSNRISYLLVRFDIQSLHEIIPFLEAKWKSVNADLPFDYYFLNDGLAKLYDEERNQKTIASYLSALAIIIAALGIFGTSLFFVMQRIKEIGIRKILGSKISDLFSILFKPIFLVICLACAAGTPIAYLLGEKWLEQYAYKINFNPLIFLLAFGLILLVVTSSMIYHFRKLIQINPIDVLRQA